MAGNWTNWTFIADRFSPSVCVDWTWLWTVGGQTITNMYKTFDVNLPLKNILIFGRHANSLVLPKALFPVIHRKLKSTLGQFEKQVNFFFIKAPFCFLAKVHIWNSVSLTEIALAKVWSVHWGKGTIWTRYKCPILAAFNGFPLNWPFRCPCWLCLVNVKQLSCQGTKGYIKWWVAMPLHVSRLSF